MIDLIALGHIHDVVAVAHDLHALDESSLFIGIIIDDTTDFGRQLVGCLQFLDQHLAGGAGADDHDPVPTSLAIMVEDRILKQPQKTIGKADRRSNTEAQHNAHHIVGTGHIQLQQPPQAQIYRHQDDKGFHHHP